MASGDRRTISLAMTKTANFYSDTQTKPSRAMREAMLDAEVGDERHDADPTTLALCERVADLLGMEKAVFLPSGTMCNEIAIAVHCRPGDEVICSRESHIIFAESGGPAALSGVMVHPIDCDRGLMTPAQIGAAIRRPSAHTPRSRLLVTEQTSNLGGGAIWPQEQLRAAAETATAAGLAAHLDGARLLNASVASGVSAANYAAGHDSAWIAFTKGLGCPVGAVLAGSRSFIDDAWLHKRRWGGAMRQTGVLAAMCLFALDNNVDRLAEDHALAHWIGEALTPLDGVAGVDPVETNIVSASLAGDGADARGLERALRAEGLRITVTGERRIRIVTHMDVDRDDADRLVSAIARHLEA